jgi:Holliday junction resolvase
MARPSRAAVTPERDYQRTIVELLDALGWASCHTYPLRTEHGWRTGTTAKGWPDLVALRGEYVVAIEVKSDTGRVQPEQLTWLQLFAELGSGRAWIVSPRLDFGLLGSWLQYPERAPRRWGF